MRVLEKLAPAGRLRPWRGNADAHIKASLVGSSVSVIIESGTPSCQWQGIFLAEFDGPRKKIRPHIKTITG